MGDFVVAIPSYKRAEEQPTLKYLKGMGIRREQIYIFVQTENDLHAYKSRYDAQAQIEYRPANSVAKARNNILAYFDGSQNVLMLDDDIKRLAVLDGGKLSVIADGGAFIRLFSSCFNAVTGKGQLFGVYPVYNAFFMDNSISTRVTVNTVLGFPKGYTVRMNGDAKAKEDIELCGEIIAAGGCVYRFNNIAVDAKHRTNPGGCKDTWATDENQKAVERLCFMFPDIFASKKGNPSEVRLVCKDKKIRIREGWGTT